MYSRIVPGRNALPALVQTRRNISVRPVKNHQRLLIILQKSAVWIRLGQVPVQHHLIAHFPHEDGNMRSERTTLRRRNRMANGFACTKATVSTCSRTRLNSGIYMLRSPNDSQTTPNYTVLACIHFFRTCSNFSTSAITTPASSLTSTENTGSYFGSVFSFSRMSSIWLSAKRNSALTVPLPGLL